MPERPSTQDEDDPRRIRIGPNSLILPATMTKTWAQRVAEHPNFRLTAKLCQGFTHEERARTEDRRPRV